MTIAITGATGQLGRLVIAALGSRAQGEQVVALARDPAAAAGLGDEARAFDYNRPETLEPALAGVDTLLLISSNEIGRRAAQHGAVIDAARHAGVSHIVYTSTLHAPTSTLSLAEEHRATEAQLKASGIAHTLLRNGWYTENILHSVPPALEHGALIGSAGEGRFSFATRADLAEAAAIVLTDAGQRRPVYELAGDEANTLGDVAAELSRRTGRTIPYVDMPEAAYAAALAKSGMPQPFAQAVASWDAAAAGGAMFDDGRQLSRLLGRPTTGLAQSLAAALP